MQIEPTHFFHFYVQGRSLVFKFLNFFLIDETHDDLYEGMIGQSELPPLPLAYRASELSCTLSPILSQSDKLSDNSDDMSSSITQISKDFGEFETDDDQPESNFTKTTDRIEKSDDDVIFIKPLSDIFPYQNDLCHFVCQTNRRPPRSEFIWRLNGRKLQHQSTLVRVKKNF